MNRKLILSVFVLALIFVGCQKSGQMDQILNENPFVSSSENYILKDAAIEDAIELVDYEIDFLTAPICGTYESGPQKCDPKTRCCPLDISEQGAGYTPSDKYEPFRING